MTLVNHWYQLNYLLQVKGETLCTYLLGTISPYKCHVNV